MGSGLYQNDAIVGIVSKSHWKGIAGCYIFINVAKHLDFINEVILIYATATHAQILWKIGTSKFNEK